MTMFSRHILIGRVMKIKFGIANNNKEIANLIVSTNEEYISDGIKKKIFYNFNVDVYDSYKVNFIKNKIKVGDIISVEGDLIYKEIIDNNGIKRQIPKTRLSEVNSIIKKIKDGNNNNDFEDNCDDDFLYE